MNSQKLVGYAAMVLIYLNVALIFFLINGLRSEYEQFEILLIKHPDSFDKIFERLKGFDQIQKLANIYSESEFIETLLNHMIY